MSVDHGRWGKVFCISVVLTAFIFLGLAMAYTAGVDIDRDSIGGVSYVTGGFGIEERNLLAGMSKNYNLKMEFSNLIGKYIANVSVSISKPDNREVFSRKDLGPILMVNLPRGKYRITATFKGTPKTRNITVTSGMKTMLFQWHVK